MSGDLKLGDDSQDGATEMRAWRHIYTAGKRATAGTVVIIHGGVYASDWLLVKNSGSSSRNRIVFMADPEEEVSIVDNTGKNSWAGTIHIEKKRYVVVDGLKLDGVDTSSSPALNILHSSNCAFANMTVQNVSWPWPMEHTNHSLIHGVNMNHCGRPSDQNQPCGISFNRADSSYNTLQYCAISRVGHDMVICINGADHNKILNNVFNCYWGMGWAAIGANSNYNLFEGNWVRHAAVELTDPVSTYKPGIELSSDHNTVRRNIILDGRSRPALSHGIEVNSIGGGQARDNVVYNNVIYRNGGSAILFMNNPNQTNNKFVNNIIYANAGFVKDDCNHLTIFVNGNYTGTEFHHNLILYRAGQKERPNERIVKRGYYNKCESIAEAQRNASHIFHGNINTSPRFFDEPGLDFHLAPDSPCIDAGVIVRDPVWGTIKHKGTVPDIGAFEYWEGG